MRLHQVSVFRLSLPHYRISECLFSVPKDYFNASAGLANVALARSKAKKQPARGSIMLNPGPLLLQSNGKQKIDQA
jgi:hypothetical protein